jgi:plastocyanin
MLEDLWTSILEFTSQFVIPDWGGLIALLPVAIFALVLVVLVVQFWRIARAAPARRGKARIEPRPPVGVHMPGPSFAPIFAAVGAFLLFLGVVFGGLPLVLGAIGLAIGLLYWLREGIALYERDVERTQPQLPAVVHEGPPEGVHMPGPSFRPLIASLGAALVLAGLVFGPWLLAAGIIALTISLLGWLKDATGEYRKVEEADETGHLENLPDPRMPSVVLAVFAVLVVGAVLLQTGALPPGQAAGGEPGASPGASAPPGGGGSGGGGEGGGGGGGEGGQPAPSIPAADVTITAQGLKYLESSFDAPADTPFTIAFVNLDPQTAPNVAIHEGSATGPAVFTGEVFNGVEARVYDVDPIPAGTYTFICSVHPSMTGTANIQ